MRTRIRLYKFIYGLALLAALLLAFAPSINKFSAVTPFVATDALCTSEGLKDFVLKADKTVPANHSVHPDCGYCTLLTSANAAPSFLALQIVWLELPPEKNRPYLAPHLAKSSFPALGSRGPPAV